MGPQGNGASIVEKAVLAVAYQRQAACRKLSPDLVCPTGLQVDGHQGQRTVPAENLIGKNGFLVTPFPGSNVTYVLRSALSRRNKSRKHPASSAGQP